MAEFIENHKAFLTPLSPIHIGCGEDFEPTDYVIRENVLYGFDPASVPLTSRERGELASCALKRTLQGWARFFKRHEASFYAFASTAVPVCERVARNYKRMIETTDQRNDNVIQRSAYVKTMEGDLVYFPGSSLKGAFHTALLDKLKPRAPETLRRAKSHLDRAIFRGEFASSPMRLLKIGDFMPIAPASPIQTRICDVSRVYKNSGTENGKEIPSVFETVNPGQDRAAQSEIAVLTQKIGSESDQPISEFDLAEAVKALHAYNLRKFSDGQRCWGSWTGAAEWARSVQTLLRGLAPKIAAGKVALIHIGKNQGADCLTLRDGVAQIYNRQKKVYQESAATVWQCQSGGTVYPFGWAILEIDAEADEPSIKKWCDSFGRPEFDYAGNRRNRMEKQKQILEQIEKERLAAAAQEEAERQEKEAEARQQEKLLSLSENQRAAEELTARMEAVSVIKPVDPLFREVLEFLRMACEWPLEDQKFCAERPGPLLKRKGMYVGKHEKELKTLLRRLRQEVK